MSKPVVLTGLRANNDLHIGNYFGALLPIVDMAKNKAGEYQVNLFVPDLHSFTTPIDHSQLYVQILHNLKLFVAAGLPLDNMDVHIYRQSFVPAHSELTVILNSFTGFGEMSRMTQFKDKSAKLSNDRVSVGLFDYPVLMAADILLYDTRYVPVGDDQSQHIEFARDIAERMNNQFGELFTLPEPVGKQHEFFGKDQGLRIKDLNDPTKKMSKSDDSGKGVIFLSDDPKEAAKKVLSATTDSVGEVKLDLQKQPGIANLLQILALNRGSSIEDTAKEYAGRTQYSDLKKDVAAAIEDFLTDFQRKLNEVDIHAIEIKLQDSEGHMNEVANQKLALVQKALGLRK
jgi:tryptophanyl-tRNA synthetase